MIDQLLLEASQQSPHHHALKIFYQSKIRYVVGRNDISLKLSQHIKIDAIIDDFYEQDSWNNIAVIHSDQIIKEAVIINCSTSISPVDVHHKFSTMNGITTFGYYEIMSDFFLPNFVSEAIDDLTVNKSQWHTLYNQLADDDSRKILRDILLYRLTANYHYMKDYSVRIDQQYFEDFMEYHDEIFVDAGGFIGDTSEEFVKKYPDYRHIYLFEPCKKNMAQAKRRLAHVNSIDFIEYGLSNQAGQVAFNDTLGSSSIITESGNSQINVTTIDQYITDKTTFIKMDLEGFEIKALSGATNHIKTYHPTLAIAVYHTISDFWKIYQLVTSIRDDYDIYLRHYTQGWSETIMYFKRRNET